MPFIENFVRKLHRRYANHGEYEELLSEAILASLHAEKRYDPDKGKFSAYARRFIEGAVIKSITKLGTKQQHVLNKVYKALDKYVAEHNAIPNIEVILESIGVTKEAYEAATINEYTQEVYFGDIPEVPVDVDTYYDLYMNIDKLPEKWRLTIYDVLADRPYNTSVYKTAIRKLKDMMND
jgi:DNA-directed RNA polymerase specialized sigma subunit